MAPKQSRPDVVAVVLGGGRGTRLSPLTRYRSKPAVPLAGKYRLVDVPISNCINSGIRRIFVLTQFNSASLNRHVGNTYNFDQFSGGRVEVLAAEQTPDTEAWFQGTADAVRRSLVHVLDRPSTHVLILSGDALYRQDYCEVLNRHIDDEAEITVCCKLVTGEQASDFGIVGIDRHRQVTSFVEKPKGESIPPLKADVDVLKSVGLENSSSRPYLASMGIYLFKTEVLVDMLRENPLEDFGRQIIPQAIGQRRIVANLFDGYWEDIGTISAFFQANLDLLLDNPSFSFFDSERPIFTHSRHLPSSEIRESNVDRAMIAEGCVIRRASIRNSIVGIRSSVADGSQLENVVMMGADYFEDGPFNGGNTGRPALGVGQNCIVKNAIIDKNARIGDGVKILNEAGRQDVDADNYSIKDGIVIVTKDAIIPPGTVI